MDEVKNKNRWMILGVVLIGPFMATLDSSIVNVALPIMARKLSVGIGSIQWVVTSYLIVISSLILIFGRISDLIGKKIVYQSGFLIFSFGSLLCGISKNIKFLIISRVIQAMGAAMIMACNQAIITATFPSNERGRALGLSGTTVAIGTMVGPPLGGVMVGIFNWESIFLINIPIGLIAFFLGSRLLPKENIKKNKGSFDLIGALIFITAIITLFLAMLSSERGGSTSFKIFISLFISLLCFNLFYFYEKKLVHPLLDFSLFQNKMFTVSILCGFISFSAIFCTNIIHPFYLQYAMNMPPQSAGVLMIVFPVSIAIVAPVSGYLSDKIGSEILTFIGLIVTTSGLIAMSFLNSNSSYLGIIFRTAIIGIGNGLFQSPNNSLVMSSAPMDKLGTAGGVNGLIRNLGMVSGIAFSMTLLYNRMSYKIGYRVENVVPERIDVFIYAMRFIYVSASVICVIGVVITFFRLKEKNMNAHRGNIEEE